MGYDKFTDQWKSSRFAIAFSGEGSECCVAESFDDVIKIIERECGFDSEDWSPFDVDSWSRDELGNPFTYHTDVGEMSSVSVTRVTCELDANLEVHRIDRERIIPDETTLTFLESQPWSSLADVPLDAWFRFRGQQSFKRIIEVHPANETFHIYGASASFKQLLALWEWTLTPLDESSWRGCNRRHTAETHSSTKGG